MMMNLQQKIEKIRAAALSSPPVLQNEVIEPYELLRLKGIRQEAEKRSQECIQAFLEEVPSLFRGKTFDDFKVDYPEQKRVKELTERYVATFADRLKEGANLLFEGRSGTGKTLLSLIIYQVLAQAGFTVSYKPSLQFLRIFREKNFESQAAFESLLASYKRIQFLIIDEATESLVTGGPLSNWEKEMFFSLINARYQEGNLCTLLISNRSRAGLIDRLGERIVGRLMQNSITLAFNWNSYR